MLPQPPPNSNWNTTFDRILERERLRTECRRITITACMLGILLLVVLALKVIPQLMAPELIEPFKRLCLPLVLLLATYILYELAIRFWMGHLLGSGKDLPVQARYLHVLVEVTLPTLALLIMAGIIGSHQALASSIPYIYFLFIFLTALNLDARLSFFAGAVAGVQFTLVSLVLLGLASDKSAAIASVIPMLVTPHQYIVKGFLLIVSGLLAGFIARHIRRQIEVALHTVEERDRAVSIFGQHVSPQVAEMLLTQPLPSIGEERNVCVMFLDIRDFSKIAGNSTAPEVMAYLNKLFGFMIPIVNQQQGIVNKFLGDGFMAVFGAPVDDGEQCQHAMDTAFAILAGVDQLNQTGDIPATRIGIGLHMGIAVTGNVGSLERKEYTIIGDVVNLASRIEQATKQFDAKLLVSSTVWEKLAPLGKYQATDLGLAELKGQEKPTRLFKLA
jgi:adenylate cyclase